jgi:tetratricopeptide (TPR) repeat protein
MSDRRDPSWPPAGDSPEGADSIAAELASRMAAVPSAPDDAMDWASVAAAFDHEASALGPRPAAAQLLFEAGRIYEEHLCDPAAALTFHRRALGLDPGFLPNLRACRRLAMDLGDDALACDALQAEAAITPDPAAGADLLLLRGRLLAGLGKDAEAQEALARAAATVPGGFAAAEEAARIAAAAGDRASLVEAYVRCAQAAADRRLSAHYLSAASALLEEGLGQIERAGALALDAFSLLPDDPLLRAAARRHAERLRRDDALAEILRAEAAASTGRAAAEAWASLAHLQERRGRPEDAIAALERGRAAAPADPLVLSGLARMREARGAWADASDALEALAAAHLSHADPGHHHEAILAKLRRAEIEEAQLGRTHVAIECCRQVVELDPQNRAALAALGRLCARLGDWDGLLAAFDAEARAARDPRERAQRIFKAAEVLEERLGRVEDALARYREALALDPDLLPARAALERVCESEGRWDDVCALLEADLAGLRSPTEEVAVLFRIARIREERLQDVEGAAAIYERILALDSASRAAAAALESVLGRLGRIEPLAAVLAREAAVTDDPRRKVAILQRRAELVDEHLDDPELARSAWEDVRAAAPRHLPALRALGRLHARAGRWAELAAMYRAEADAAAEPSDAADLVHRVGEIMERRLGRPEDAIAAYREATMLAPAHAPALQALARLYRARGEDENLVDVLRSQAAARTAPEERAAALVEAAHIAEERLGERERAIESYEEAMRIAPAFEPAVRALDRLYAETGRAEALAALRRTARPDGADRAERLLRLARLEADRMGDAAAALRATEELLAAAPGHPAGLLLELRLVPDPARRARARSALAEAAEEPEARAALLAAAALELRPADVRREALARAAAFAPGSPSLAPEEERRLRASGDFAGLARFCEARRDAAEDLPSRASWSVRAGEAWERAGEAGPALLAFQAALEAAPANLPALRGARTLFARREDWAAVRGTLQAEGAALRDPHGACTAFLQAGAIAEQRFGDPDAAVADYRMAAERDPLDPEPLRRLEALLGAKGAGDIAALHEARALAARDAHRAAESWLAAARAALETPAGRDSALVALDRALAARPDLAPALELRARLHAEEGRPREALTDLEACLALGGEPSVRLLLHLSAAALCDEVLHDEVRTTFHLQGALTLAPESPEALARLARLHAGAGRAAEAAAVLRRLVDVPGVAPDALVAHLLELAEADARSGALEASAASLRRVLALDAANDHAHRLLVALAERAGDRTARVEALAAAAAAARDRALRADAHVGAAHLLMQESEGREQAAIHLRAALEVDPARVEARAALAGILEDVSPSDATAEHLRLIERAPLRAESWTALYRQLDRQHLHDRAYVAASVLRWLGAPVPGPGAERLLLEGARQSLGPPPPLGEDDLLLLRAPGDGGPLGAVLEVAGDAIAAAIGEPAERHGDPLPEHPIRRAMAEAARALGAPEWEIYPGTIGRVDVEPAVPYAVHVGPDIARRTTAREQRFLVGRAAARLRTRSCLAELLPAAALEGWVTAAVRSVVPGYAPEDPVDEEMVRRVAKGLSRRVRRALEEPARALARASPRPDVAAWCAAAAATADRVGLVLCGDVPAAIGLLLRDGRPRSPEGPDAVAAAGERPDVLALLAFAATEAHAVLRQRARVAIA